MSPRIVIVGAGAIGLLVAAHLSLHGKPVTLVARTEAANVLAREGLQRTQKGSTVRIRDVPVAASVREALADGQPNALIILAVKSYDTPGVAAELESMPQLVPPLLTLQNGIGNEEQLAAAIGTERVIAGVITTPATLLEPGHVMVERSAVRIGAADMAAKPVLAAGSVVERLQEAGFQAKHFDSWQRMKWTKLVMNLLCNASCALLGWPPRQVWSHPGLAALEIAALREALAVMQHLGYHLVNLGRYPLRQLESVLRHAPQPLLRGPMGYFVAGGRGSKMPSLYLDLEKGRRQSEVRWLNGAVIQQGKELGLAVPANEALYETLTGVLEGKIAWEAVRGQPDVLLQRWHQR